MIPKLKTCLLSLILVSMVALADAGAGASAARANPLDAACRGAADTSTVCQQARTQQATDNPVSGPKGAINKAANIIAIIGIFGAIFMILIGGLFYITAAGHTDNVNKARERIINAVIGIGLIGLAWAVVRFVTDRILS